MEFLLHNEEGIQFPPIRPAFTEGELFFDRFRALTPRDAKDSIIGEGGTGLIHLVRDELMDRVVALKLPHESILRDPSARFDVIRETRQAIELTHPHIVRIHDFHEGRQGWGISMQYVRGKNLDEWRHEGRAGNRRGIVPYAVERIEGWVVQLCDALIYAHEDARMVHRDIKPKNLMLERRDDGHEKLLLTDFGITQKLRLHTMMLSRVQPGTNDKNTMGTLPYMPWEQIQGSPASALDDVYAVGATIYELLTGRPPFYEGGYEQIRVQIEKVVPPSMAQRLRDFDLPDHGIPRAWEDTVAACLAKKAEDRPQSVREIVARLGLTSNAVGAPVAAVAAIGGPELDALHLDLQQRTEEIEALRIEVTQSRTQVDALAAEAAQSRSQAEALAAEAAQSRAQFEAAQAALEQSQAEIAHLQGTLEQSGGRIGELEQAIAGHQAALGDAGGRTAALDAELGELKQSLALVQAESVRWKESYESLEQGLEGEQQEMLSRLQTDVGEKDRQLSEARGHHEQLQKNLAALELQHAQEQQQRASLEASLLAAQQAAGASAAEIEQRFQAEIEGLKQAVATAQQQALSEQQTAAARIQEAGQAAQVQIQQAAQVNQQALQQAEAVAHQQVEEARAAAQRATAEAEQIARKNAEQAMAEARTKSEAAQKEAARSTEEARKATAAADEAKRELNSMKDRQTAPLMPLLYVLLGALVVGGGLGVGLGKLGGKSAVEAAHALNLSPYSSSIPEQAGSAGAPVTAGLFRSYLSDQKISSADGAKIVPGLDSLDDAAPVTGVTWWVAENFCAWLGSRELSDADRTKGRHFRIATAAEITKSNRGADAPAEWTSDPGDSNDSPAGARKIITRDAKADGSWQMPSLGAAPGGAKLAFRVSLAG
ncbi:MAG: serine/threonine protein kinase [Akkermansiaceae bacterium]|nr:serine/threonine protein kinase [Akkermansiaceae bacterium]